MRQLNAPLDRNPFCRPFFLVLLICHFKLLNDSAAHPSQQEINKSKWYGDSLMRLLSSSGAVLAIDLLNPSPAHEAKQHKLKQLVQGPRSFFMDVKCPGCFNITTVFSHAQTVVLCGSCATVLCQPTGGKCRLTEGCSFRRKHVSHNCPVVLPHGADYACVEVSCLWLGSILVVMFDFLFSFQQMDKSCRPEICSVPILSNLILSARMCDGSQQLSRIAHPPSLRVPYICFVARGPSTAGRPSGVPHTAVVLRRCANRNCRSVRRQGSPRPPPPASSNQQHPLYTLRLPTPVVRLPSSKYNMTTSRSISRLATALPRLTPASFAVRPFTSKTADLFPKRKASLPNLGNFLPWTKNKSDDPSNPGEKGSGIVSSLLYGTPEAHEDAKVLEQGFSKKLGRGKYVHEIIEHKVKPDRVEEYLELIEKTYPKLAANPANNAHHVGSWRTVIGELDSFIHIWEYKGYSGYHETIRRLNEDPMYSDYLETIPAYISSRHNDFMQEFAFWPTSSPRTMGGVFELRTYDLRPGNLLQWETAWRRGLECRKQVMQPVGAWFTQMGRLNRVHHLWQFENLQTRKKQREECWQMEGWAETVHETVPLMDKMESRILVPLDFSPLK
ncbi:hypothetical protein G7K_4451-t1 [Saitoella complicata NRRL Y-17804]|uniref:40S ribosomal protein S27 n=1 Tax=Saitoella complicata (strain BCRC 22490 / CBS 7301 / JCM 7358 / NBRC 10748 / NRRL Y-17804) TaxID=698492 RepID=A0A0E9NKB5_SAICN|nr:hypothetical protein G7K_4451-t1 [Saitoella complicata NRRL Y-17804]